MAERDEHEITETPDLEAALRRLRQEVAHRRRAEEANAKFAAIVEHSNDGIIGLKLDGTIVTWNRGAERIFGYTSEEACGLHVGMLSPAERADETSNLIHAIRRGEIVPPFETKRVRRDGAVIDVALTASPICDADGRVVGASWIARDITRRKQAERALRESEARANAILDTAVDAIITIDARGIVESFNRSAERLFGCAPQDVIGKNISVLMPEPDASRHDAHLRAYLETGKAKIIGIGREVVARRMDGTTFPAELAVSEVRLPNKRLFTGIVRDISERKRLEQQILEISDREKRRISQDLHDSLGQLLTGVGFKSKSLENKLSAKGLGEAEGARQIAELVTRAINDARSLARGLQPVEPRPAGLMSALEELATNLHKIFGVACTFRCDEPVEVTDAPAATNLYRIAQEASHNAIKHGGAAHVTIELSRRDGTLRLAVEDDGIGFAAPPAITSPGGGDGIGGGGGGGHKGLGLQIMRYRAAMIGGTVTITRREPAGTLVVCESPSVR